MRALAAASAIQSVDPSRHRRKVRNGRQRPQLERLEPRLLFAVAPLDGGPGDYAAWLSRGGLCNCPICSGAGLDEIPIVESTDGDPAASNPLSSLPQLHSNAGATAKLFLDFNGNYEATWGSWSNATTPVYDQDGDATTFSDGELASIYEIWARVAEDYAPFNIDVTTVDPGSRANQVVAHIAIGGNWSDWYGNSAGGVAYIGGFYNSAPNVGFVFEAALGNGHAKYVAEAASHEAGHLFGLQHQALWSGSTLVQSYNQGNADWAPIMGTGYYSVRTTFYNGATSFGPTVYQDDLAILANASNAFGYRADDFGSTLAAASALPAIGTSVNFSGLIGRYNDADVWSFTTGGGSLTMQLAGAAYGANLDAVLELWDSSSGVLLTAAPSNSLGASFSTTVGAGTFYLVARSLGDYGDMGQYTITGSLPPESSEPEIALSVSGAVLADGGTLSFGTTTPGAAVTRTVTVTNQGGAALTLTPLNAAALPAGFTLVSNLGATTLGAGQSTTFAIRLDAAALGSFSGAIQLLSDDADEATYDILLSGSVAAPEIGVALSGVDLTDGQAVSFGSTNIGQSVTRVFTVTNLGNSTLTLTALNPAALPSGFTLVSNLGSTSLAAGQSTQFSVRLDAAAFGSFGGTLQLLSNDADENPFDLALSGTVLAPEITLRLGGANVTDGQAIDFGNLAVGNPVTRTFTVINDGNDTLTLTAINPASLPAGFSLTANLGSTSLAAGQSTSFTIQFDAALAGSFSGNFALANSDSDENPFDLSLSGAAYAPASEITVSTGGQLLTAGGLVAFGSTVVGTSLERTFTIRNDGTAVLNLAAINPATLPAGFSLYQNLGSTALNPGESTTFILRLDAAAEGAFAGSLAVVSDDADESTFTIQVSGTVAAPTPVFKAIVDDGNAGSSTTGAWSVTTGMGKGHANDLRKATKGTGSKVATWTFNNLDAGQYQVFATWKIASINATNSPFTIYDNTISRGTTLVNQRLTPGDLSADSSLWKSLGVVTINSGKLVVKLTNKANNRVVADAIRIERVGAVSAPVPDIGVDIGGYDLTAGQNTVMFGSRDIGSPLSYPFTITNHGAASLQIAAIDPLSVPAGFSLVQNVGSTFLTPGDSTTFTLRLDATATGAYGGTIAIASNDADEGLFTFQVSGTVVDPNAPVLRILDDGAAGHTQSGGWKIVTGKGYANDIRTAAKGTGSVHSTWSFGSLPDGQYNVWATWKISSVYATNAPFSTYNGNQLVGTTLVNQRLTPTGLWDGSTHWQSLGVVTVNGGVLKVKLTNAANGTVVADAVRIEKIVAGAPAASLSRLAPASGPNLLAEDLGMWLGSTLASAAPTGIAPPRDHENPDSLPLPTGGTSSRDEPPTWTQHCPTLEEQLLVETLELLSLSRSALGDELPLALEVAADELSLAALG